MKLRQKQEENETGASSRPVQRNWNFVQSLKVPNKVRLFLWRVLHNSLPTNSELQRRHLFDENLCGICGQQGETILHLFRDCHFARQYWAISNFPTASIYWDTSDIWDWINGVRVRLDGQEFGLFVLSCWSIWYCRNKLVHDQQLFTPLDTYHYVVQHWNFLKSNMFKPVGRSVTNSETVHGPWKKPPMGQTKLNFDAVVLKHGGLGGIAVVARDHTGLILAWRRKNLNAEIDVETGLLHPACLVVQLANDMDFNMIMLEGDSLHVVRNLKSLKDPLSTNGALYTDVQQSLTPYH